MNAAGNTAKALGMEEMFPHSFGTGVLSTWAEICNPGLVHSMARVSPSPQIFPSRPCSLLHCAGESCAQKDIELVKAVCASQHRYICQKRRLCAAARTDGDPYGVQHLSATRALGSAIQTHQLSKGHSWPACTARPGMNLPSQDGNCCWRDKHT